MPYEFSQDGYRQFSEAIVAANGDQATLTTLLADMQDTFNDNIGKLTKLDTDNKSITAENERLRNANMELFLRIGTQAEPGGDGKGTGTSQEGDTISTADYMENYFKKLEEKK